MTKKAGKKVVLEGWAYSWADIRELGLAKREWHLTPKKWKPDDIKVRITIEELTPSRKE